MVKVYEDDGVAGWPDSSYRGTWLVVRGRKAQPGWPSRHLRSGRCRGVRARGPLGGLPMLLLLLL